MSDPSRVVPLDGDASEEEMLAAVVPMLDAFGKRSLDDQKTDAASRVEPAVLQDLAEMGLFGLTLPEGYGGTGGALRSACAAVSALARHDRSVATTVGLHLGLGTRPLVGWGSARAKEHWLPLLATGEVIAAFAATEPGAGSDLSRLAMQGTRDGESWRLNGPKIFVTNGGLARMFTILAGTPGVGGRMGRTLFLVDGASKGLQVGPEEHKMGLKGSSTTSLFLDDVTVASDHVLGAAGHAARPLASILAWGRTVMAAGCTGAASVAVDKTLAHTATRRQFGRTLDQLELVAAQLEAMKASLFAMTALVNRTSTSEGADLDRRSTAAKVFCSQEDWNLCDRAIQLHGGSGYLEETGLPLLLRDARITRIFEGANDVLQIHLGLGILAGGLPAWNPTDPTDPLVTAQLAIRVKIRERVAEVQTRLGARAMRRQLVLHRLGRLGLLLEAGDAVVERGVGGSPADRGLAASWLERTATELGGIHLPSHTPPPSRLEAK